LLQNAFKFTHRHTQVTLKAFAAGDRILIEVADNCGGLPSGDDGERMFRPFTQNGHDRTGAGLGLSICRRSVDANGGILSFHDIPGTGCVFTIDLPRQGMGETGA
jgi:signal transduction histidine kinase